jgi:HlyD family secretion protein
MHGSRSSRLLLILGVTVLLASAVSARWAVQDTKPTDEDAPAARAATVVCLGYVDLEQSVASLSPLQSGRVAELLAHENDLVTAGAPLVRVEETQARLQVAEAQVALDTAREQLAQARTAPEQQRARLERQQAAVEAARHRLAAAQALVSRKRQLLEIRQVNAEEVAAAEDEVKALEAGERAEAARLAELKVSDPEADIRRAELNVAAVQTRLDQARHTLDECTLKAPAAGRVLRILVSPGDVLQTPAQQPAILFAPDGQRLVRAEIDQEFAARVTAGQSAMIEDDAPSGARWKGRVLRLADWYHQRRTILREPSPSPDTRTVECLITLDPGQSLPRLGQRVRVTIGGPTP